MAAACLGFVLVPSTLSNAQPDDEVPPAATPAIDAPAADAAPIEFTQPDETVRVVSTTTASARPSVSADGRLVVWAGAPPSEESTLANPRASTIWLADQMDGSVIELTPRDDTLKIGDSILPVISGDGCSVAFITQVGYDLFRDDDRGSRWDVYRATVPGCEGAERGFELVSTRLVPGLEPSAVDGVATADAPAISGSGSVIAYTAPFTGAPSVDGVQVVDLGVPVGDPGRTRPVAGTPATPPNSVYTYRGLRAPTLSDDGQLVGFLSDATSAAAEPGWADGTVAGRAAPTQAFVWDRSNFDAATAVVQVSAPAATGADGAPGVVPDGGAEAVRLSGDGRYAVFTSRATNLVSDATAAACAATCPPQVYRTDRLTGSITLVSGRADADGTKVAAATGAVLPSVSFDGNEVAFISRSNDLFLTRGAAGTGAPDDGDVLVATVDSGSLRRVSLLADGVTPAPASNSHPAISGNGRVVVFDTDVGPGFGATVPGRAIALVVQPPHVTVNDLDVGTVGVGYTGPEWYLPVRNEGPSTFTPALVISSNPDFVITGGTCDEGAPISPGGSCTITLVMLPSEAGPATSTVLIAESGFGGTGVTATVRGAGGEPALNPVQSGHSFGSLAVGMTSEPYVIEVRNVGLAPVVMGAATITGPNAPDFRVVDDGCRGRRVGIADTCAVQVEFSPIDDGVRNASVRFTTEADQYTTVLLAGAGVYPTEVLVSTPTVTAGESIVFGARGFRPGAEIQFAWADGRGRRYVATANESGGVLLAVRLGLAEVTGARTLVASSGDGLQASVPVRINAPAPGVKATSPAFAD